MPVICFKKKKKKKHSKYGAFLILSCDKLWSHAFTKRSTYKLPTFKRYSIIMLLHTKSLIKPKNQWIYAKNTFCAQLSLVLREHVNQNCMEIPREQFFSLAWLLAYMKSASLVSCVVNKPNMLLTNYANDFVNTKSHTCKREICSQAGGGGGGGGGG